MIFQSQNTMSFRRVIFSRLETVTEDYVRSMKFWWKTTFLLVKYGRFIFRLLLYRPSKLALYLALFILPLWKLLMWIASRAFLNFVYIAHIISSMNSVFKPLCHVIGLWLPRSGTFSISDWPNCFRYSWSSRTFSITRAWATTTKYSRPLQLVVQSS